MSIDFVILTNTSGPTWQRSIGAYQVAYHCRQYGFSCQVIDFTDHFSFDELTNAIQKFVGSNTLAIGVSTSFYSGSTKKKYISADRSFDSIIPDTVRSCLVAVKQQFKNIKLLAGGAQSYQVQSDDLFDAVFHGYSEQSVLEYLISLKTGKKRLWPVQGQTDIINGATAHFDIQTLAHTWSKHDCILPQETLPIEISRGCIFKCKFCSYPLNGKKKFDYLRSAELIKEELETNYRLYGTTNYYFTDDTFNDSTYKLEQLHKAITSLPFKIKFVTYLRLDLLYRHQEQIKLLYEMGLGSAFFGIETLNWQTGKAIGKGMNPQKIKEFLVELHDVKWKKEIPITCSFIIGLPHETIESVQATHKWCESAPINDVWFPLFIRSDTHYKSEFDINFSQYGYKIDQNEEWYNDNFKYAEALALAEEYNQTGMYHNKFPSTWFLFSLLSYGYTINELKNIASKDLPWRQYTRDKKRLVEQYKKLLFNLS
jgi:radical SAM superfamily enzyme YgiQ (UPF0313 family)